MNLLLDTHTLLWWLGHAPTLSKKARAAIRDSKNLVYVSAATAWEITIKKALGKLKTPSNFEEALAVNQFWPLPVNAQNIVCILIVTTSCAH